ncbi:peptide chain release factor N(5)-glutamine methyltransferase [Fluviicola chungangensis]|uniref:Release factor glutamine methyltransferase n=1 Tax=Fluviicola chungangensis TaxID=2597671 RepID=A0A556N7X5_9FLAO|nr:peptide chain release factor N(5)-glutamine methyltransferase [Fluviicola chungangensis]TSJ48238.1 peptide chain release factor N(5)-glutamine methyltransferase [Fluviicola chungangensis]
MQNLKQLTSLWTNKLFNLYSEREVRNILLLVLEDIFGFNRSALLVSKEIALSDDQLNQLDQISSRLQTGEPVQYLIGFTYFDDLKIEVAPGVLIPRPETEELVSWIMESAREHTNLKVEDWCTGSGCIALAIKNRRRDFEIFGLDVSEEALLIARSNARKLNLNIEFEFGNALDIDERKSVDLIVSNPPYIPWIEKEQMHMNVTGFEPDLALFVPDEDPLLFYRAIAEYAVQHLNNGGYLFFELHENYSLETKAMVESLGFDPVEVRKDLQGKERMLKAKWTVR